MGAKADYVARFRKGQRVLVIGRLEIGEWQTREGETRVSYDAWADDVVNLSPREEGAGPGELRGNGYGERRLHQLAARSARAPALERQQDLDDLPF
jgi:single-stranded DNA-binding protein